MHLRVFFHTAFATSHSSWQCVYRCPFIHTAFVSLLSIFVNCRCFSVAHFLVLFSHCPRLPIFKSPYWPCLLHYPCLSIAHFSFTRAQMPISSKYHGLTFIHFFLLPLSPKGTLSIHYQPITPRLYCLSVPQTISKINWQASLLSPRLCNLCVHGNPFSLWSSQAYTNTINIFNLHAMAIPVFTVLLILKPLESLFRSPRPLFSYPPMPMCSIHK